MAELPKAQGWSEPPSPKPSRKDWVLGALVALIARPVAYFAAGTYVSKTQLAWERFFILAPLLYGLALALATVAGIQRVVSFSFAVLGPILYLAMVYIWFPTHGPSHLIIGLALSGISTTGWLAGLLVVKIDKGILA